MPRLLAKHDDSCNSTNFLRRGGHKRHNSYRGISIILSQLCDLGAGGVLWEPISFQQGPYICDQNDKNALFSFIQLEMHFSSGVTLHLSFCAQVSITVAMANRP